MAGYPATASSMSTLDVAALSRTAWSGKVKEDMVRDSIFSSDQLMTKYRVIGGEVVIDKPGIVLDVSNVGKAQQGGGQSVYVTLRTGFGKAPQEGTGEDMLNNEDELGYKYAKLYYNEIKKSVKYDNWGYNANDFEYLGHKAVQSKYLARFWSEWLDFRYHQAAMFHYAQELTHAPVSLTQRLNKNWGIVNLDAGSFPAWDPDAVTNTAGVVDSLGYYSSEYYSGVGTMVENLAAAMLAGSGVGASPATGLNVDSLAIIHDDVDDNIKIDKINVDKTDVQIFTIANKVWNWMLNPSNTDSLATVFVNINDYRMDKRPVLPGEIGRLFGSWLCVKDPRAATLVVGGSQGSYTLTPGYIRPNNNDDRGTGTWSNSSAGTNYLFDVCMLLGPNAFARYLRDDLMMDLFETTEYKKREGRGSYMGDGIQLCAYDIGTQTAATQTQQGCMCIPVPRNAVGTIH